MRRVRRQPVRPATRPPAHSVLPADSALRPLLDSRRWPLAPTLAALALLVLGWLSTVALGLGGAVAATWAGSTVVAGLFAAGLWAARLAGDPAASPVAEPAGERDRGAARLLLALLALSFVVRFAGLDHEVAVRSYLDEGTYHRYARSILAGDAFPISFVYPHFYFYLQSMAFWLLDALAPWSHGLLAGLSRAEAPIELEWLTLRLVSATLSALAVVPVFLAARRLGALAGRGSGFANLAAAGAALLLVFSPLYDGGAHLAICDAPSGAFAALVVALGGRILALQAAGERPWGLYALAGIAAAAAAGTKYPAGVVAVAIVAVAVAGMVAARRVRLELGWAGGVSLAAFLAMMPALLVHAERVFGGGRDILFGVRQYAGGGWIGVQPASFATYYGRNLVESFGGPVLVAALVGLLLAPAALRRRTAWLAAFPVVFLLLLGNMTMVVRRNLFPVVPVLAMLLAPLAVLAVERGVEALAAWSKRRRGADGDPAWRRAVLVAGLAALLVVPLRASLDQTIGFVRPTTRDLAATWIRAELPPGAFLVKESYTPDFAPSELAVRQARFAARLTPEELRQPGHDFLLLASSAFQRFLDEEKTVKEHQQEYGERYRRIRAELPLLAVWEPGPRRLGPRLELYRILPLSPAVPRREIRFAAADAFVPDPAMLGAVPALPPAGAGEGAAADAATGAAETGAATALPAVAAVHFTAPGQWAMVKGNLAAGSWVCRGERALTAVAPGGVAPPTPLALRVVDHRNRAVAAAASSPAPSFVLPADERYFLYFEAEAGSILTAVSCGQQGSERPKLTPGPCSTRRAPKGVGLAGTRSRWHTLVHYPHSSRALWTHGGNGAPVVGCRCHRDDGVLRTCCGWWPPARCCRERLEIEPPPALRSSVPRQRGVCSHSSTG
jgi:hypothetical protein